MAGAFPEKPEALSGRSAMCIIPHRPCDERSTALLQFAPVAARRYLAAMLSQTTRDPRRPQLATWSNPFWEPFTALCWLVGTSGAGGGGGSHDRSDRVPHVWHRAARGCPIL